MIREGYARDARAANHMQSQEISATAPMNAKLVNCLMSAMLHVEVT